MGGNVVVQVSVERSGRNSSRSFDTIEANLVTDRAKFPTTVLVSTGRKKNSREEVPVRVSTFPL